MKYFKRHTIIIAVLVAAFLLRFVHLAEIPALNADEAALGYNAYSLIQTGKDEHGVAWPIHFQSFNDYKPALYGYIILPFIKIFGLNEMTVRAPGAFLGVLNVFVLWLLIKDQGYKKLKVFGFKIGLEDITAMLLAFSPWHIHFSRGGWEVNAATMFITAGIYFSLRGINNHVTNFVYAAVFFVASLYTYHAARLIVPLLLFGMAIIYFTRFFKVEGKKVFFGAMLFGAVLLLPLAYDFLGPAGSARASGVSIFSDRGPIDRINEKRGQHNSLTSSFAKVVHNKPLEYALSFSENYMEHFWGEFLFLSGDDIQRNKVPEFGLLYTMQFPFLLVAFFAVSQRAKKWKVFIWWLLISPVAAAITFQSPHALRAQNMVIPLTVFSAFGLYVAIRWLSGKKKVVKNICYISLIMVMVWSFSRYIHQYYVHMAKTYPFSSQYGLKELMLYLKEVESKYTKIYITDRYDQPYILYLFYTKEDPREFQKNHVLTDRGEFGFSTVSEYGKYNFRSISWDEMRDYRNVLLIGTNEEIPEVESNVIKTIYFPNNDKAFEIVEL